ncbi:MAG TPA: C-GCAxxG-C-C family protein [Nitrospirota bacterium]|nr:C-GCAxxG-C-C family protein [Nitrospirota bacterium]
MDSVDTKNSLSRRDMLINGSKIAAATALAAIGGIQMAKKSEAYENPGANRYKYVKLDPNDVAQTTYDNYFNRWCTSSVIAGFTENLKKKGATGWNEFPIDAYRWAHGGFAGWGALCGTMPGAGVIIGLVTKDTDIAEAMTNDLAFYYSYTDLPSFTPAKVQKAQIKHMTMAGTPVCHISVGRWMRAEGAAFLSNERQERCARVAANVAAEATKMLNAYADGTYKPQHKPLYNVIANGITSQNNCSDCHGQNPPSPKETYESLDK